MLSLTRKVRDLKKWKMKRKSDCNLKGTVHNNLKNSFRGSRIFLHPWSNTSIWLMCSDHAIFVALCQTAWGQAKAHGEGSLWQMHSPFFSVLYLALNRVTVSCWNHHTYLIPILFSVRFRQRADRIADTFRSEKTSYLWFLMAGVVQRHTRQPQGEVSLPSGEVFKHALDSDGHAVSRLWLSDESGGVVGLKGLLCFF